MAGVYDVVIVGGGPAGEHAAGRCTSHGLSTALVERDLVGGECSFWACMPSKTLLRPGQVIAGARRVPGASQAVTGPVDADAALARRDWMTAGWDDKGQVAWLDHAGATLVRGHGRLAGTRRVEVTAAGGSRELLTARRAVILATGSVSAVPPVPGLSGVHPWGSREATSARTVPRRLLVLGGGAVGVELAQAWRRLGAGEVTVVEAGPRLLPAEEPFASEQVADALTADGISVITGAKLVSAARDGDNRTVTGTLADGRQIIADELLVAAGRRPDTRDLGLETVGLQPGQPLSVDDTLRAAGVTGGWLYVIGDLNGIAPLTHMGKYQARIAAEVIAGHAVSAQAGHRAVPRVTFTDPQVAAVGLTEAKAREQGISVRLVRVSLADVAAAPIAGQDVRGTAQLVVDEARQQIVGATFTGPDIGESLHAATIAIAGQVPMGRLRHAVAAFPTLSEMWLELILAYQAGHSAGHAATATASFAPQDAAHAAREAGVHATREEGQR